VTSTATEIRAAEGDGEREGEGVAALRPELRIHAKIEGHGEAYDDDRLLGHVDYKLKDVEETNGATYLGGDARELAAGLRNIYGIVAPSQAGLLAGYVGAPLILHLQDGRRLPFTVAKVLDMHRFLVQALGGFR
jgi:hypothetical protein